MGAIWKARGLWPVPVEWLATDAESVRASLLRSHDKLNIHAFPRKQNGDLN